MYEGTAAYSDEPRKYADQAMDATSADAREVRDVGSLTRRVDCLHHMTDMLFEDLAYLSDRLGPVLLPEVTEPTNPESEAVNKSSICESRTSESMAHALNRLSLLRDSIRKLAERSDV